MESQRTNPQNRAIHLFCRQLSDVMNAGGFSVMEVMRHDADIPWNERLVKELIWRKVQEAMLDKKSTTELSTAEVSQIYEVINRHIAESIGLSVPFPSNEPPPYGADDE